jgi:hypothetical protein
MNTRNLRKPLALAVGAAIAGSCGADKQKEGEKAAEGEKKPEAA